MEWFECKVRYDKTLENGLIKKATDTYLVDAISFTEAEARFIEEIEPFMTGEYIVTDIKRAKIAELFESNDLGDDHWFKARVAYIELDEKTAVEKRRVHTTIVQAHDFHRAVANLDEGMKGTLGDWAIVSITETPIIDIFKINKDDEAVTSHQ